MPLSTGTHSGSYEIFAPIGAGGMGEVYRARDAKLNRDAVLQRRREIGIEDRAYFKGGIDISRPEN